MTGDFAADLVADQLIVAFLWKPDGSQASSIVIRKEIWINTDGRAPRFRRGAQYPVFHVYNYVDPSKAIPFSGCRMNEYKEPFLNLEVALVVARRCEQDALQDGNWVYVEDVK